MNKNISIIRLNKWYVAFFILFFILMGIALGYYQFKTTSKRYAHENLVLESAVLNLFKKQLNSELNFYISSIEQQKPYYVEQIMKELNFQLEKAATKLGELHKKNPNHSLERIIQDNLHKCCTAPYTYVFNANGRLIYSKNENIGVLNILRQAIKTKKFPENCIYKKVKNIYIIEYFSPEEILAMLRQKIINRIDNATNKSYLFAFAYKFKNGALVMDSLAAHPRKKILTKNIKIKGSDDNKTFNDMQKNLAPTLQQYGESFYQYRYKVDENGFSKVSYFKLIPEYKLILAKGFLKHDMLKMLKTKKIENKNTITKTITRVLMIFGFFAIIGLAVQAVFLTQSSKVFNYYKTFLNKKDVSINRISQRLNKSIDMQKSFAIQKNEWQKKFNILSKNSGQLYFEFNPINNTILWGDFFDEVLSVYASTTEFSFEDFLARIHRKDKENIDKVLYNAEKNIGGFDVEFRFKTDTAGFRFLKLKGVYLSSAENTPELLIGLLQDISVQKKHQLQLTESENLYKSTIDAFNFPIYVLDSNYNILIANRAFRKAIVELGYSATELSAKVNDIFPFIPPKTFEVFREVFTNGLMQNYEEFNEFSSNDWRYTENTVLPIIENSKTKKILVMMRNVTQRKIAEIEKKRLWTAIEQANDGIVITDTESNILYVNPIYSKVTGYTQQELLNKKTAIFQSGKTDEATYDRLWSTIQSGQVWQGEMQNRKKNGELFTEESIISPVKNEEGEIVNYVAIKRDVTEEKKRQLQMIQDDKMRAIGTLAGGIAHDFNNILATMYTYLFLLELESGLSNEGKQALSIIKKSQQRAKELVAQILDFSRQSNENQHSINPLPVVEEAINLLSPIIPSYITIEKNLQPCKNIYSSTVELHQLVTNLCTNAKDAIDEKGKISIELLNHKTKDDNEYVLLKITDTGNGIDIETQKHIFDPFFTTKKPGDGTGLGLATVHNIVKKSGGFINVKSKPFKGTCFEIFFKSHEGI